MTYGDALEWLDRHVNLERIERGTAGRYALPTLDRMRALLTACGDPQRDYPILQVTGTNGKGSTCRIAASLLRAQGVTTGLLTSPHQRLNDRIATDEGPITDAELAAILVILEALEPFLAERYPDLDPPSWFELVTAAGYRHLSDVAVEAAVVEVGMGGRYDATSVADATVGVVTNVELDHVEILGPDRPSIASEKAGILKAGTLGIIGETDEELAAIFAAEALEVGAAGIWRRGIEFGAGASRVAHGGRLVDLWTPGATYDDVFLPLFGAHQAENAAAALAAVEAFLAFPLDPGVVAEGFAASTSPGRLEVVSRQPLVLLDGAHNEAGAAALGLALEEDFAATEGIVLVLGCLTGRDPYVLLEAIGTDRIRTVVATAPETLRALPAAEVAAASEAAGLPVEIVEDVEEAVAYACRLVGPNDGVVVTGSLYVVWEARAAALSQ